MNFDVVAQRLRAALGVKSDKELANALGMKPNAFYNRRLAGSVPFEEIFALLERHRMRSDWVFFDLGSPFRDAGVELKTPVVGNIIPEILQEVFYELELALAKSEGLTDKEAPKKAAIKGGLAAFIYPRVAHIQEVGLRRGIVRELATEFAQVTELVKKPLLSDDKVAAENSTRSKRRTRRP